MEVENALKLISEFKGDNLKIKLGEVKTKLIGKSIVEIPNQHELFKAALMIKKLSAQIDEIVHATGIINCLPKILEHGEIIESLSLASGAEGEGIDLITNKRIAEFKFAIWQQKGNGMRKRQVFADCVNLFLFETDKKKELYVVGAEVIEKYFQSRRASWRKTLSKSGELDQRLDEYFRKHNITGEKLNDVFSISKVKIIDVEAVLPK